MIKLFSYLKGLTLVHWAAVALKNLWPFLVLFIFWPEIDSMMGSFSWWREYCSVLSQYLVTASNTLRDMPILGPVFEFIDESWSSIRHRLLQFLT
jgi:hypothetical protein